MDFLLPEETSSLTNHIPELSFKEERLEQFCQEMAVNISPSHEIILRIFALESMYTKTIREHLAYHMASFPGIRKRIAYLRAIHISTIEKTSVMVSMEAAIVLKNRLLDPKTSAVSLAPIVTKLSELLGWKEGDEVADEDPIKRLLDDIIPDNALPSAGKKTPTP